METIYCKYCNLPHYIDRLPVIKCPHCSKAFSLNLPIAQYSMSLELSPLDLSPLPTDNPLPQDDPIELSLFPSTQEDFHHD